MESIKLSVLGLVAADWETKYANHAAPYTSTIVFLVRKSTHSPLIESCQARYLICKLRQSILLRIDANKDPLGQRREDTEDQFAGGSSGVDGNSDQV